MIESDAQEFDCDTCPFMDALDEVWSENREAWGLFQRMCSSFTHEFHLVPMLLQKVVHDLDVDDAIELTERLTLIYDKLYPPPPKKS